MMRFNNLLVGPVARLPWRVQTKLLLAFLAPAGFCTLRAREAGFLGTQDGRASINFRVLSQLIKA
jgi:hypothetical protein